MKGVALSMDIGVLRFLSSSVTNFRLECHLPTTHRLNFSLKPSKEIFYHSLRKSLFSCKFEFTVNINDMDIIY